MNFIPFNKPYISGGEIAHIHEVLKNHSLCGGNTFSKKCEHWLESNTGTYKSLLLQSGTAALEMTALIIDIKPGDEIIMPSFTFVSTANAFVLRGAIPVFVDIRDDTLNIDESKIEAAITKKTKAIVPVHYAGVACEMDTIMKIADKYGLMVIEDAAHGIMSSYKNKSLGAIGNFGTFSFHETKNIIAGEGGTLLINDKNFIERAEIICEKGTDRIKFKKNQTSRYSWQGMGSSYLCNELTSAFLWGQLEHANRILQKRLEIWHRYNNSLGPLEDIGWIRRPVIPKDCSHNAHIYYVLLNKQFDREKIIADMKSQGIEITSHYVPLHTSPAGQKYGRADSKLTYTDSLSKQLLRFPLWFDLSTDQQAEVTKQFTESIKNQFKR